MGRAPKQHSRRERTKGAVAGSRDLTAGDLARLLHVDLKTIHNWVNQGHVFATRTEGRHLRFQRVEVVRFLRRFGYPVPAQLGEARPRVLVQLARARAPRIPGVEQAGADGLFSTVLEAAAGGYEIVVFFLDLHGDALTRELVQALRSRPETRALAVVGVSRKAARRAEFVASGGDLSVSLPNGADIAHAARWLTGGTTSPPRGALTAAAPG